MWGKLVSSVSSALDFNQATLSGSIDVIVVPQADGGFKSTPFHVRFGKAKLLRSREKIVSITVNDTPRALRMTLGAAGEAYFAHPKEDFSNDNNVYSPLLNEVDSPLTPNVSALEPLESPVDETGAEFADRREIQGAGRPSMDDTPLDLASEREGIDEQDVFRSSIEFSLCGHLLYGNQSDFQHDKDIFEANITTWEIMDRDPALWYHPSLVARFPGRPSYYPGRVALPMLASWNVYNQPLSLDALRTLMSTNVTAHHVENKSWLAWMQTPTSPRRQDEQPSPDGPRLSTSFEAERDLDTTMDESEFTGAMTPKIVKSLRPTSDELGSLGLQMGANTVTFTVTSSLQGEKTITGTIYLWPATSKIVVSDVDGTITKSDVLGQLMPIVGKDWSHAGVAELFSRVGSNGYQLLYLTARAIGQADSTRDYLFGLTQKGQSKLPDGPLICSPDRLFPSFRREVIDRQPYVLKIAALRDIRNLFPSTYNPFYAGFGNRDTDHRAYVHLGIPEAKVFIIDAKGTIHHLNKTYAKTYDSLAEIAEDMFPSRGARHEIAEDDKYNSFNFWRLPSDWQRNQLKNNDEAIVEYL